MLLELFRSAGGDACVLSVQDTLEDQEIDWRFRLEHPLELMLCFLNGDCTPLLPPEEHAALRKTQAAYFRVAFGRAGLSALREMIDHVLVCTEASPRGFDPIVRLAAYSYAQGLFDLSRVASCTEKRSLETSVVGARGAARMAENWGAILDDHAARLQSREALFEALLADAANQGYPFELSVSTEYSSFAHLLKALAAEMIQNRRLLRRCPGCRRYALAGALPYTCVCGAEFGMPDAAPKDEGEDAALAQLYKRVYTEKANAARYDETAQAEFRRFEAQAKDWRLKIRRGKATKEAFVEWLEEA